MLLLLSTDLCWDSSTENHKAIVGFLLRESIKSASNQFICRSILVNMYSGNMGYTVEPLVNKLSFAGIQANHDPIAVQEGGSTGETDLIREAFQLREAAVAVLKELYVVERERNEIGWVY